MEDKCVICNDDLIPEKTPAYRKRLCDNCFKVFGEDYGEDRE